MKKLTIDQWTRITGSLVIGTIGEAMRTHKINAVTAKGVEQSNSYEEYVKNQAKWEEEKEKKMRAETCDAGGQVIWIRPRTIRDLGEQLDRLEANQREMLLILNTIK